MDVILIVAVAIISGCVSAYFAMHIAVGSMREEIVKRTEEEVKVVHDRMEEIHERVGTDGRV